MNETSVAQQMFGELAPQFADLTDRVLFGEVWANAELSPRDRSLITIATLTALHLTDSLPGHLEIGLGNGLTVDELSAAITHSAFYAGWPKAFAAMYELKKLLEKDGSVSDSAQGDTDEDPS